MHKTQTTLTGSFTATLPAAFLLVGVILLLTQGGLLAGGRSHYYSHSHYGCPVYVAPPVAYCPPRPPVCYVPPPVYYYPRRYPAYYVGGYYGRGYSGYRGGGSISFSFWR